MTRENSVGEACPQDDVPADAKDWEITISALAGLSVEEWRARRQQQVETEAAIDRFLEVPRTYKCFMSMTMRVAVEVESSGCVGREGKVKFLRDALRRFEEATGILPSWDDEDITCDLYSQDERVCSFSRSEWYNRQFDKPDRPYLKVAYAKLPPGGDSSDPKTK